MNENPSTPPLSHPFSAWSFLFGTLFVLAAAGWAAVETELIGSGTLLAAVPVTLIVLGVAGLALTLRRPSSPRS